MRTNGPRKMESAGGTWKSGKSVKFAKICCRELVQLAGVADKSLCADFGKSIINKLLTGDVNYATSDIGVCGSCAVFPLCNKISRNLRSQILGEFFHDVVAMRRERHVGRFELELVARSSSTAKSVVRFRFWTL